MSNNNSKIVVMGSFIVDLMGRAPRLPKPGETILGKSFQIGPGGKGSNQAVAAKRAGADVSIITKLGGDEFADIAFKSFKNEDIPTDYVYIGQEYPTGAALIMVDEQTGQNKIMVIIGANNHIVEEEIERARGEIEQAKILLLQLETNLNAIEKCVNIAKDNGVLGVLNPAPAQELPLDLLRKIDILTPNESEAETLCGVTVKDKEDAKIAAEKLLEMGPKSVIITMGGMGSYIKNNEVDLFLPSIKVDVVDTTGAGDAYNGGLVAALAEGKDLIEAAKFANIVGALCVTKIGTAPAMPSRWEIDQMLSSITNSS